MKTPIRNLILLHILSAAFGLMLAIPVAAQTFMNLHNFTPLSAPDYRGGTNGDGAEPEAGLILSGNTLYGMATYGGSSGNGTVFRLNTDGSGFTNLYNFTPLSAPYYSGGTNGDGAQPSGPFILSGNILYGMATYGGRSGNGTVFRLNTDGSGFTNLYNFTGGRDGGQPIGSLILSGFTLYGAAPFGGAWNNGTLFKLNIDGSGFTNLYHFTPLSHYNSGTNTDGASPYELTLSGNTLYGTALLGGSWNEGTVFRVNTDGSGFTNLHNFTGGSDGADPIGALLLSGSTLYGTTQTAGISADPINGAGTVFRINTDGSSFTNLHSFNVNDGAHSGGFLILLDNALYGTAAWGSSGKGTVFRVNMDGSGFTNIYNFAANDGIAPNGLTLAGNTLYGTAGGGGSSGNGTVFSLLLAPIPLQVTTGALANGTNGSAYSQPLIVSGGQPPYSWALASGLLPSGLTLATNGFISGIPMSNGTFNFNVIVTDALSATATQPLTLTVSGSLDNPFTFTTNNGKLTITGYTGPGGSVTIPDTINGLTVTSIGMDAFYDNSTLTSITMPDNITSIGESAFDTCTSLTNVTLGTNVTSIEAYAFNQCLSLSSVTIPSSVTNIANDAFQSCYILSSVTIPAGVASIGDGAFANCLGMAAINVNPGNPAYTSIAGVLFSTSQTTLIEYPDGRSGTSYTIPNSVSSIGNDAFWSCSLTNVMIPNGVTNIGDGAFGGCGLTSLTIPNSVTKIGQEAFFDCINLTNIMIPNSVIRIGDNAFEYCTSLTSITVATDNPAYCSVNGVLFDKYQTTLVEYPGGLSGDYTIPDSVISIGDNAFSQNMTLTSVTIPNGVTSIGREAFGGTGLTSITIPNSITSIGDYAFYYCTGLTSVHFQGDAPSVGGDVFDGNNNVTVYYLPGTSGWGATFGGIPTALWFLPNPLILKNGASFGVQTNGFGFIVSWATNIPVVVQACTNLANPVWQPVATNPLNVGTCYFSDAAWTNYHSRFYRVRSP